MPRPSILNLGVGAGSSFTASHGTNSSVTPGAPASIVAGQLLTIIAYLVGATALATPTGWTKVAGKVIGTPAGTNNEISLFWKKAVGSDTMPAIACVGGASYTSLSVSAQSWAGADDPTIHPPVVNSSGASTAVTSYDFGSNGQSTYNVSSGVIQVEDLICTSNSNTSNTTFTYSDPHSQLSNEAIHLTDQGNGGVGGFSAAYGTGASSQDGQSSYSQSPVHVVQSLSSAYFWAWFAIPSTASEALVVAGSLNHMTASGAVVIKNAGVLAGSLSHMISTGAVAITDVAAIAGSLNHMAAAGAVEIDDTAITAGLLNNMTAAIVVEIITITSAAIAGLLNNMTAEISGVVFNDMNIAGLLGNITADADVTIGDYVAEAGTLGNITGTLDVAMGAAAVVGGLLGEIIGASEIEVHTEVAIAGMLAHVIGMIHIKDRRIKAIDPNAIITVAAADYAIVVPATDTTIVVETVDQTIVVPATDRTLVVGG